MRPLIRPANDSAPVNSHPRWVRQAAQRAICQRQPGNQENSLVGAPTTLIPGALRKQRSS